MTDAILISPRSPRYHRLLGCLSHRADELDNIYVGTRAIAESQRLTPCKRCGSDLGNYEVSKAPARWELPQW